MIERLGLCLLLSLVACSVGCGTDQQRSFADPSAEAQDQTAVPRVLRALPDGVDGVHYVDLDRLQTTNPAIAAAMQARPFRSHFRNAPDNTLSALDRETEANRPIVVARAGRNFEAPDRVGAVGAFDPLLVVVFAKSIASVRNMAESGVLGVETAAGGDGVYKGTRLPENDKQGSAPQSTYLSFPDEFTIVIADDQQLLTSYMRRWKDPSVRPCVQWSHVLSTATFDAPLIVLRTYDAAQVKDSFNPWHSGALSERTAPIEQLALAVVPKTETSVRIVIRSRDLPAAWNWLRSAALGPGGTLRVVSSKDETGIAELDFGKDNLTDMLFLLTCLSGPNVYL